MRWDKAAEKLMHMDDETWMRHAHPWSVLTRILTAPLLFLAIWSHVWIGWWAVLYCALFMIWTWLNPRIFPKPDRTDNWMSKGVFGERVFIARKAVAIPAHHERAAHALTAASAIMALIAAYGFIIQDFWAACLGFHGAVFFKVWFVDRMVWLYEDMKETHPPYHNWLKS